MNDNSKSISSLSGRSCLIHSARIFDLSENKVFYQDLVEQQYIRVLLDDLNIFFLLL